ncbi:MAG: apolipoprotein N-acyltransferase [Oligoflexia bacterium]|nr:apolipoprotein N-acyltransferase [Oligoflexia bacterium]
MIKRLAHKANIWAIFAGIFYVLAFPRWDIPILLFLFFPALLGSIYTTQSLKQSIGLGLLLSTMISWGGFMWIVYVAQNFGGFPLPLAIALQIAYCLIAAPQILLFYIISFYAKKNIDLLPSVLKILFWPMLYISLDYLAGELKVFPEYAASPLVYFTNISQIASLGGISLLSFLPLFFGSSFYFLYKRKKFALPMFTLSILLIASAHFWGKYEIKALSIAEKNTLQIGLIQHNIADLEASAFQGKGESSLDQVIQKLINMTSTFKESKPDLVLWPETAYPIVFPTKEGLSSSLAYGYANLVRSAVASIQVPLLFGGYERFSKKEFNSGILLDKDGTYKTSYQKEVLLVFGEYMPFDQYFPSLKTLNPQMGDFGRGEGPFPIEFHSKDSTYLLGVNICYEAILLRFMRQMAKNGAQVFVNLTKDSWFGDTFEPWQHFQLAQIRSIEHRIPTIRATNTGLSGTVSITGETKLISLPFVEAQQILPVEMLKNHSPTLYTRIGDWFFYLSLIFCLSIWAFLFRRARSLR